MKSGTPGHTKMKRFCRRMDIPIYHGVGILEMLWDLAQRQTPRGDVGRLNDEDIALAIDFRGDEHKLVESLAESGWLEPHPEHRYLIHDWWDHAEDGVHMKIARSHQLFADGRVPKLGRLGSMERPAIERFYAKCVQNPGSCAQTGDSLPQPPPSPLPSPEPAPSTPRRANGLPVPSAGVKEMTTDDFPDTTITVRGYFPSADDCMVIQIVMKAILAKPDITDRDIARHLCEAYRVDQYSPALFLDTLPRLIRKTINGNGNGMPSPVPVMTAAERRREEVVKGLDVLDGIRRKRK